jgi:uncharacterized protein
MPNYLSPGVYVEEVEAGSRPIEGVGTAIAAFVGLAKKGPADTPMLVSNWTQFTETFGDFMEDFYLAHAVYGYFLNGGGNCYVVRIGVNGNGSNGKRQQQPTDRIAQAQVGSYRVAALPAAEDKTVKVEIDDPVGESPPEDSFKLVINVDDQPAETYDAVTTRRGKDNVVTQVKEKSKIVSFEEIGGPAGITKPDKGVVELVRPEPEPVDPASLEAKHYVGDVADRTGFSGLEAVDDVTMVAVPDVMAALQQKAITAEDAKAIQLAMIAHCELMGNRVAILDPPPEKSAQGIKEWRKKEAGYDSNYATVYWPWIRVFDPASGTNRFVPPSGHMAGIWARNDDSRGVHKAPANEVIRGAISLETQITKREHDLLNPEGINCIRSFPGRGVRVWGARTLSSDAAWRYLNVRRLFNYLEESILQGTQWVVFEPNDPALWARIRRTISAFLVNEWRKGALFGVTPEEAFYVKCDSETNPAEGIDAGQVVCEIGVAPVKPAEFVVFRLAQFSGGTSLVAE